MNQFTKIEEQPDSDINRESQSGLRAVTQRLHHLALVYPQASNRIDQIIGFGDDLLSSEEGNDLVFCLLDAIERSTGQRVSLDWLFCGERRKGSNLPRRMFCPETGVDDGPLSVIEFQEFAAIVQSLSKEDATHLLAIATALCAGDCAEAREIRDARPLHRKFHLKLHMLFLL